MKMGLALFVIFLVVFEAYGLVRVGRSGQSYSQNGSGNEKSRGMPDRRPNLPSTSSFRKTERINTPTPPNIKSRGEDSAQRRGGITFGKPYKNIMSMGETTSKPLKPGPQSRISSPVRSSVDKNLSAPTSNQKASPSFDFAALDRLSNEERLQKVLARAGLASRREAQVMIADGRVKVNGKVVLETGAKVNFRKDQVSLDGKIVTLPDQDAIHWVALNKPKGVVTTMKDDKDRDTVLKYLPKAHELRLVPVGRLEKDSTGLILFTNEVGWIHPLTHLSFMNTRRYQVSIRGIPSGEALDQLNFGTLINKETDSKIPKCPCFIRDIDFQGNACLLEITLTGTSSNLLAEIVQSLGSELVGVKRTSFGPIELKGLKKGDWRELTKSEVMKLKESCMKNVRVSTPFANPIVSPSKPERKREGYTTSRYPLGGAKPRSRKR